MYIYMSIYIYIYIYIYIIYIYQLVENDGEKKIKSAGLLWILCTSGLEELFPSIGVDNN